MKKSNKKRDQKRSAKARKQLHDKVCAQKQQEMYEAGSLRSIERERERARRHRIARNFHAQAMHSFAVGATLQQAAMESLLADMDREDQQRRLMRQIYDKQIDLQVGLAAEAATFLGGRR